MYTVWYDMVRCSCACTYVLVTCVQCAMLIKKDSRLVDRAVVMVIGLRCVT